MKKMVLASVSVAVLLFTGCSQKNPDVDMTTKNQKIEKVSDANQNGSNSSSMTSNNMDANTMAQQKENAMKSLISDLEQKLQPVYFDFDKYSIKDSMKPVVQNDSNLLNGDKAQKLSIKIEGNCDEWGTDEYNYALGLKRAKTVKDELSAEGVNANRMMIISYGKSNPTCTEHTKACWAKNRRADFKLLP
ncbi:MAG: peptidoglycan-associated lipoprotein Pal [Sulfurospirillaceae bacterium]|nr:peptidoglycan-associated lipoprotein Pal [Sulfurospirillaceae bacterium]